MAKTAERLAAVRTPARALAWVAGRGAVTLAELARAVAGGSIAGSWWAHPEGARIFRIATALEASPELVVAKVVRGQVTFLHRRHLPALLCVVTDRAWRARRAAGLPQEARALLARVARHGTVRVEPRERAARAALERLALVHAASEHTERGHHATVLTSWPRFAGSDTLAAARKMSLGAARAELSAIGIDLPE